MRGKRKKHRGPGRLVDQPYVEGTTYNPHLKAAILEVVENLIRDDDPSETRQTLERLLAAVLATWIIRSKTSISVMAPSLTSPSNDI